MDTANYLAQNSLMEEQVQEAIKQADIDTKDRDDQEQTLGETLEQVPTDAILVGDVVSRYGGAAKDMLGLSKKEKPTREMLDEKKDTYKSGDKSIEDDPMATEMSEITPPITTTNTGGQTVIADDDDYATGLQDVQDSIVGEDGAENIGRVAESGLAQGAEDTVAESLGGGLAGEEAIGGLLDLTPLAPIGAAIAAVGLVTSAVEGMIDIFKAHHSAPIKPITSSIAVPEFAPGL